jgi:hypothetical protein
MRCAGNAANNRLDRLLRLRHGPVFLVHGASAGRVLAAAQLFPISRPLTPLERNVGIVCLRELTVAKGISI